MFKTKNAKSVQKPKGIVATTQQHLNVSEFRDNTLVLKDGSIRAVFSVSSVNFDLKSEQEQNSLIYGYQGFLNTLEFPVQVLVKSRKMDVDIYLENMQDKAAAQTNNLLRDQTYDYVEFVKKLVDLADIMKKEFYIIVPNDPIITTRSLGPLQKLAQLFTKKDTKADFQSRFRDFASLKKGLDQRCQTVQSGIGNMGLTAKRLTTYELVELFYNSYNPQTALLQKMPNLDEVATDQVVYS